ncbi:hypothetical protein V3C99_003412 [Haemonchus contortus]
MAEHSIADIAKTREESNLKQSVEAEKVAKQSSSKKEKILSVKLGEFGRSLFSDSPWEGKGTVSATGTSSSSPQSRFSTPFHIQFLLK